MRRCPVPRHAKRSRRQTGATSRAGLSITARSRRRFGASTTSWMGSCPENATFHAMKHRTFPGTDLRVSEVGFGTWTISTGWWGEKTDAEAIALLRAALDDHGVTFFDAADAYGNGRAERLIAEAFRGRRD